MFILFMSFKVGLIASIAIGLAVDDTIHYLVRYNREFKRLQWLYPPTAQKFFLNLMGITCDRLENLTECFSELKIRGDSNKRKA